MTSLCNNQLRKCNKIMGFHHRNCYQHNHSLNLIFMEHQNIRINRVKNHYLEESIISYNNKYNNKTNMINPLIKDRVIKLLNSNLVDFLQISKWKICQSLDRESMQDRIVAQQLISLQSEYVILLGGKVVLLSFDCMTDK